MNNEWKHFLSANTVDKSLKIPSLPLWDILSQWADWVPASSKYRIKYVVWGDGVSIDKPIDVNIAKDDSFLNVLSNILAQTNYDYELSHDHLKILSSIQPNNRKEYLYSITLESTKDVASFFKRFHEISGVRVISDNTIGNLPVKLPNQYAYRYPSNYMDILKKFLKENDLQLSEKNGKFYLGKSINNASILNPKPLCNFNVAFQDETTNLCEYVFIAKNKLQCHFASTIIVYKFNEIDHLLYKGQKFTFESKQNIQSKVELINQASKNKKRFILRARAQKRERLAAEKRRNRRKTDKATKSASSICWETCKEANEAVNVRCLEACCRKAAQGNGYINPYQCSHPEGTFRY